jgi:UDP-N-acetylglucosamine 2-epimerase (non-hydrolysing)
MVGTDMYKIIREVEKLLDDQEEYKRMSFAHNPYGDGKAAERIVEGIAYAHGI